MARSYYASTIERFINLDGDMILASMVKNHPFDLNDLTRDSWLEEIDILKKQLAGIGGYIMLEYMIPRMGKRVDAVVISEGLIFLLEFKVGAEQYTSSALDQVMDYALDLKNFHADSYDKVIVPVVVCTEAPDVKNQISAYEDDILHVLRVNKNTLSDVVREVFKNYHGTPSVDAQSWQEAEYKPTPTIIEAAQALFNKHTVEDIYRNDAEAKNLSVTMREIKSIIKYSRENHKKSIVFVTGVPGAGKTLVGLKLATELYNSETEDDAVFLSGNQPLVTVLQEALSRDKVQQEAENGNKISKDFAKKEVKKFIQIIHHYRDYYVGNDVCPYERIAIFDESQRAWTKDEISSFMARKKGIKNFVYSEPEFLISTMDRWNDWAVIVCLVGGGQEINKGEAGLPEWFDSLRRSFSHWDVYVAKNLDDSEYLRGRKWADLVKNLNVHIDEGLHLATSIRSFRSENVSLLVKYLLDNESEKARTVYSRLKDKYPIAITRDLEKAKEWAKLQARGNERYGLFASSSAARLKPYGIYYAKDRNSISPENWFLNSKEDIRSSYFMESVASEFETQGLEVDYALIAWDADLRIENNEWAFYQMSNRLSPPNWSRIHSENNRLYLKNAYRVLLTRARQGFIIYVPFGSGEDVTRKPCFYDQTYNYLKQIGIKEI